MNYELVVSESFIGFTSESGQRCVARLLVQKQSFRVDRQEFSDAAPHLPETRRGVVDIVNKILLDTSGVH